MSIKGLLGGITALASLSGAAITFLWQGITWLQSESWPKLTLATALRSMDARSWVRLARDWPDAYRLLDAIPLSLALLGLAVLGYVVAKWGSNR